MKKRLLRSSKDKKLFGVCGGIAEYFDIDPTIIRVLCILVSVLNPLGVLAYIICAIVMPTDEPNGEKPDTKIEK